MTSQGYFTVSGRKMLKEELVGINHDCSLVKLKSSTLGVVQVLERVMPPKCDATCDSQAADLSIRALFKGDIHEMRAM